MAAGWTAAFMAMARKGSTRVRSSHYRAVAAFSLSLFTQNESADAGFVDPLRQAGDLMLLL